MGAGESWSPDIYKEQLVAVTQGLASKHWPNFHFLLALRIPSRAKFTAGEYSRSTFSWLLAEIPDMIDTKFYKFGIWNSHFLA